ncbi:DUF829-domain-containing protein [Xylariaceae sp. FL0594]|nr:DUF829-domain-containing protein [Xylariaceae sp. FL0594]
MAVEGSRGFPGYTRIAHRIYVRDDDAESETQSQKTTTTTGPDSDPTHILIYGWGDGRPKNVGKYADGYHALFPMARIYVVINPILDATTQVLAKRTETMMPLVNAVFPGKTGADGSERIILHVMSNTGGIYAAATLNAYRVKFGSETLLPHHLCISDSTPGSLNFSTEVWRWSRAMAMGVPIPSFLPSLLTFKLAQSLCCLFLCVVFYLAQAIGIEPSGPYSVRAFLDPEMADARAVRLFMYSREDDLIGWRDLEENAAVARTKGYDVLLEMFDGSPHVGHMRVHPKQYWAAILNGWKRAMEKKEKA